MHDRRLHRIISAAVLSTSATVLANNGTFLDRELPTDVRMMDWNVNNDSVFADVAGNRNAKFNRIAAAVDADIYTFEEMYNHTATDVLNLMNTARPGVTWYVYKNTEHAIASRYPLSMQTGDTSPAGYRPVAMALVDLPLAISGRDLYVMDAHYKCCGGFDPQRQMQSDAFVNWMRDARTAGGNITLTANTPMVVAGDYNLVDGPQPLTTLLNGDIQNNATYGADSIPDWNGTNNTDAHPYQNDAGAADWTWRDDTGSFAPGRLDYFTYTDSTIDGPHRFALNTMAMTASDRAVSGLQQYDTSLDNVGADIDHLPVIMDFRLSGARTLIWTPPGTTWTTGSGNNWVNANPAGGVTNFAFGDVVRFKDSGVGAVTIAAAGVSPGATLIENTTGSYTISGGQIAGKGRLVKTGAGTATLASANSYTEGTEVYAGTLRVGHSDGISNGSLTIANAGRVILNAGLTSAVRTKSVSINSAGGAKLDMNDDDLVVDYTGTSPLATIQSLITTGYNGGVWTGNGITSASAAAASSSAHKTALGYGEATDFFTTFNATFSGRSVDSTSILIRYTSAGDANLDGSVDTVDFGLLAANFGATSGRRWVNGDFDYNTKTDTTDFNLLVSNFGVNLPGSAYSSSVLIPEPTHCGILALVFVQLMSRWRKRRL